jgi:Protein  of unknown function (DUF3018)
MATPENIRRNMQNYRDRLRAQGLRPKTVWVPDTRSPDFAERVRRDSLAVQGHPSEREALDWIEEATDDDEG